MDTVEMMKKGYQDFADGNVEAVLALFTPDITWHASKGFPHYSEEAIYTGPESILKDVFSQIPVYYDDFKIEITDFIGNDEKIVMVGFYTGVWKESGKRFKANAAHAWNLRDGKLSHFFQAVDTAAIVNP